MWPFSRRLHHPARAGDVVRGGISVRVRKTLSGAHGPALLDVELQIARGEILALLGPSGTGKTTLLRLLAGLLQPDEGRVIAFGRVWLDTTRAITLPTRQRRAGLVFQDYALFPNMTVRGNVRFALRRSTPRSRADELIEMVGLDALADQRPGRLSGGQQQRLALARALAAEPDLLLLDEPLSALDGKMRNDLQDALLAMHRHRPTTTVLVTHDTGEALRLADRAAVMEGGRIVANAPPRELFGVAVDIGDDNRLTISARVLACIGITDGRPQYRIEAEGRTWLAHGEPDAMLEPGDKVLVSADRWSVRASRPSAHLRAPEAWSKGEPPGSPAQNRHLSIYSSTYKQ